MAAVNYNNAFIIGSPRSGTTLLGDILDIHPRIGRWYEPYFIFDRYFPNAPNDCRTVEDATPRVVQFIRKSFDEYRHKRHVQIAIDKSPRNSLKIPFLRAIFPDARFINILRDGRDTTLSIHREWEKRRNVISSSPLDSARVLLNHLSRQPLLKHKLDALRFQLGSGRVLKHRQRWHGRVGWGPQFEGWEAAFERASLLEFNALQWAACVESIYQNQPEINPEHFLEIRYEKLLQQPQETLKAVFDFLGVPFPNDFMSQMPRLKRANYDKWKSAFSPEEKARLGPILQPLLTQTGYASNDDWYRFG